MEKRQIKIKETRKGAFNQFSKNSRAWDKGGGK